MFRRAGWTVPRSMAEHVSSAQKGGNMANSALVRWSAQEIRRTAWRLAQRRWLADSIALVVSTSWQPPTRASTIVAYPTESRWIAALGLEFVLRADGFASSIRDCWRFLGPRLCRWLIGRNVWPGCRAWHLHPGFQGRRSAFQRKLFRLGDPICAAHRNCANVWLMECLALAGSY